MTEAGGPIAIVTDSTADIPPEQAAALGIIVIPALVTLGSKTFADGQGLARSELYRCMASRRGLPTTAAPSPAAFESTFSRLLGGGAQDVLAIHVASQLSAIYEVASQAGRSFPGRVHVVDSGQLSLGLGYQVVEAAEAAAAGAGLDDVLEAAAGARRRVRLVAMLNSLEYVRRSGRVSWLGASMSDLLQVKLLVRVDGGKVERLALVRTLRRAQDQLAGLVPGWGQIARLAVLHTAAPQQAETLAGRLAGMTGLDPWVVEATTVIGVHIGPGALGIAAMLL
ncbi:MAG: DegV family protein [Anaerolineales bacterium]|nr:DegV family protein [Anaerolineales bacterium]